MSGHACSVNGEDHCQDPSTLECGIFDRTGSFLLNFLIAGAILVVGILCYLFLLGRIEQIEAPFATEAVAPRPGSAAASEVEPPRKAS